MTTPHYDVLIEGGLVVDGTGNPGFRAAIGVRDGRVTILRGRPAATADRTVDAAGKVVAPGFIDIHGHSDVILLVDPTLEMKVRQGVTTEVIGVDGLSYAPFDHEEDLRIFAEQNAGIAGFLPKTATWRSVAEQLEHYDRRCSVNVATYVGNTALRVSVLGWGDAPADAAALSAMGDRLREAMRDGAFGLSTGLDYPPGSSASTAELTELARIAAAHGGVYHTHVRYGLGDQFRDPFLEAVEICRRADSPLHITHFAKSSRSTNPGGARKLLDLLDEANELGVPTTFDTYPYEWGGTRLSRLLPMWAQVGGPVAMKQRLADPQQRARIAAEIENSAAAGLYRTSRPFADLRLGHLTNDEHRPFETRYLTEVIDTLGIGTGELICELVATNPAATFVRPSPHAMTLWQFVCHPLGMIASDAILIGRAPSPRAYGCFPRVLADFVREERLLSLPEAIRKMTSFPAQVLGLRDRGTLRDGAVADICVFDLDAMQANATYESPREFAAGVSDVIVGGVAVLRDGELTGALPGRALRGPAAA